MDSTFLISRFLRTSYLFVLVLCNCVAPVGAQSPGCPNADFSQQNFNNWIGHTAVYPYNTPGSNISTSGTAYYYNAGIVNGRHTLITTSTPDPFTCGNVMTLPPGENQCIRLGNGGIGPWGDGVGWERDIISYTFNITPSNSLIIYKYAVVLQDPTNDPNNPPHPKPIKPRFIVSIRDASGQLIDTLCGKKEDYADTTTAGYRSCTLAAAGGLGGTAANPGDIVYRAWTTVGVDLRAYANPSQNITIEFETWDCGLGGHFGYAYLMAKCDTMGILSEFCTADGSVKLTAPEGFSYKWLPSGLTSQSINMYNVQPGDTAYVELTTLNGCKTSLRKVLYPVFNHAVFHATPTTVCVGDPINLIDSSYSISTANNSNVPINSWNWNFGDGNTATTANPSHLYGTPGSYTVSLSVTDQMGCKSNISHPVQVLPAPLANFVFNDACENKSVTFNDFSQTVGNSGVITSWYWTFGNDGGHSSAPSPSHLFTTPGTYTVNLQVATGLSCKDDTTKTIKIWPKPIAKFTALDVCEKFPMSFTDLSLSSDPADPINSWIWNFGDQSGFSSNQNPTHTYLTDNTYNVQLIVTTVKNCVEDTILPVHVHPTPTPNFSATPLCLNTPVQFTDLSTPQSEIVAWSWTFDDFTANTSLNQSPTHLYDTSKLYNPMLIVYSQYGCKDSISIPVNIPPLPEANLDANKYEGCAPLCVNFIDLSYSASDSIKLWNWNFGDNASSTLQSPYHCYNMPGDYTVSLEVTTGNTCKSNFIWNDMIHVYPIPVAGFTLTPDETTESDALITFTDYAQGADSWLWTYGDGNVSTIQDTVHRYTAAGTYTVWQYVKNVHGCVDSIERKVIINPEWAYYVPNVFTPNGDGKNEGFIGKGFNYTNFEMWIFDRWGNMIYYTNNDKEPWNGKVNNGSNGEKVAQQDVYVYKIRICDVFGQLHRYVGTVTLVR